MRSEGHRPADCLQARAAMGGIVAMACQASGRAPTAAPAQLLATALGSCEPRGPSACHAQPKRATPGPSGPLGDSLARPCRDEVQGTQDQAPPRLVCPTSQLPLLPCLRPAQSPPVARHLASSTPPPQGSQRVRSTRCSATHPRSRPARARPPVPSLHESRQPAQAHGPTAGRRTVTAVAQRCAGGGGGVPRQGRGRVPATRCMHAARPLALLRRRGDGARPEEPRPERLAGQGPGRLERRSRAPFRASGRAPCRVVRRLPHRHGTLPMV